MEIKYYGANCVKIITKKISVVVDSTTKDSSKSLQISDKDIVIKTNRVLEYSPGGGFVIDMPGEYEVSETSVTGIASSLHFEPTKQSMIAVIHVSGITLAILGHSISDLSDEQIERIGVVDVLILPVGGNGYTLDPVEATKLVKQIEPKIVIPTHYAEGSSSYEVPQNSIDEFLKTVGSTEAERVDTLKLKEGILPDKTQVIVVNPQ